MLVIHKLATLIFLASVVGCNSQYDNLAQYQGPTSQPTTRVVLDPAQYVSSVEATTQPPSGWKVEPLKASGRHAHQVWLSPTGRTAFGVIRFSLPLPVSAKWVLGPFLEEMKKSEGEANVIGEVLQDDKLPGLRYVVEGGLYKMRVSLVCKGFAGWAVYAGTLRKEPEMPGELELAEQARERVVVGPEQK